MVYAQVGGPLIARNIIYLKNFKYYASGMAKDGLARAKSTQGYVVTIVVSIF